MSSNLTPSALKIMPTTYILFSPTSNKFYVGSSREDSADKRLRHHNSGSVRSTKSGKPWKLISIENHENYTLAKRRELFLKTGVGRKYIMENFGSIKK